MLHTKCGSMKKDLSFHFGFIKNKLKPVLTPNLDRMAFLVTRSGLDIWINKITMQRDLNQGFFSSRQPPSIRPRQAASTHAHQLKPISGDDRQNRLRTVRLNTAHSSRCTSSLHSLPLSDVIAKLHHLPYLPIQTAAGRGTHTVSDLYNRIVFERANGSQLFEYERRMCVLTSRPVPDPLRWFGGLFGASTEGPTVRSKSLPICTMHNVMLCCVWDGRGRGRCERVSVCGHVLRSK